MGKLVSCADYKRFETVSGIELRCRIPIELLLLHSLRCGRRSGNRSKATIGPYRRSRRIIFYGDKLYIFVFRSQIIHGFLNQIAEFVSDVTKLRRGHANENDFSIGVTEASGFEPSVVGMPADLFF